MQTSAFQRLYILAIYFHPILLCSPSSCVLKELFQALEMKLLDDDVITEEERDDESSDKAEERLFVGVWM